MHSWAIYLRDIDTETREFWSNSLYIEQGLLYEIIRVYKFNKHDPIYS